jgi:hypothetical protein
MTQQLELFAIPGQDDQKVALAQVSSQKCTIAPNLHFLYFETIFFNGLALENLKKANKVT